MQITTYNIYWRIAKRNNQSKQFIAKNLFLIASCITCDCICHLFSSWNIVTRLQNFYRGSAANLCYLLFLLSRWTDPERKILGESTFLWFSSWSLIQSFPEVCIFRFWKIPHSDVDLIPEDHLPHSLLDHLLQQVFFSSDELNHALYVKWVLVLKIEECWPVWQIVMTLAFKPNVVNRRTAKFLKNCEVMHMNQ